MPRNRRPRNRAALILAFVAMALALVLLVLPGLTRSVAVPLDAVMAACILVALIAGRRPRP